MQNLTIASSPNNKVSIYDSDAIDSLRSELKFEPGFLRKLRIALFKHSKEPRVALNELPTTIRSTFAQKVAFDSLKLDKRFDSNIDGASKLIFKTKANFSIESVILRANTGRVSLCVSSQVGCAAACDFCATGRMGIAKNLSVPEILDQVAQANRLLSKEKRSVRNIVFMGMGEPFHNEDAVTESLRILNSPSGFHHPLSRILVSTVGIPSAMLRLAHALPNVNIALSLHSPIQSTREKIIPLAKRYSLDELRASIVELNRIQSIKTAVMLEHLMLEGINDSLEDATALCEWAKGLRVHVNLIPYNYVQEAPHLKGSDRARIEAFGAIIKKANLPTTIRYSMGSDIEAACGQLVRNENKAVATEQSLLRK